MKKKLIIIGVLVILIVGITIFSNSAKNAVRDSTNIVEGEIIEYQDYHEVTGTIIPKTITRYTYDGYLVEAFVKQGEKVDKGFRLVEVNQVNSNKVIKAKEQGVVYEITDAYISLGSNALEVSFMVDEKTKGKLGVNKEFILGENKGVIDFISEIATIEDDETLYEIIGQVNGEYAPNEKVVVKIPLETYQKAYTVPINSVVRSGEHSYIFFPSFLKHPTNYDDNDYQEVKVINVDNDRLIIEGYDGGEILEFSGLSLTYVNELMK